MKKKFLVVSILFMLFAVSCGDKKIEQKKEENILKQETKKDLSNLEKETKAAENNVVFKELETVDLDKSAVSLKENIEGNITSVIYFDNEKILYFQDEQSEISSDLCNRKVYLFNKMTQENKYLIKVPNVNYSKGDICFCEDKVYYTFGQATEDTAYNSLLEVNLEKASAQLTTIEGCTPPFVDIATTDQDVFLLKRNALNEKQTDFIIDRVDGQQFTEIAKTSFFEADSKEDDEGAFFLDIKGEEELLYVYKESKNMNDQFLCMTREGEVKETYEVDLKEYLKLDMEEFYGMQEEGEEEELDYSWKIEQRGDYFIIETINNRILMFRRQEGELIHIGLPDKLNDNTLEYTASCVTDFENGRYIFFHAYEEQVMYIFDTHIGEFGRAVIKVDGEVESIMRNKDNQFIFRIYKDDDTRDYLFYEKENEWEL